MAARRNADFNFQPDTVPANLGASTFGQAVASQQAEAIRSFRLAHRVTPEEYPDDIGSDRVPRSGVRVTLDAGWASAGNHC